MTLANKAGAVAAAVENGTAIPDTRLVANLIVYESGAVRLRIDESDAPVRRYSIQRDDVLLDSQARPMGNLRQILDEDENRFRLQFEPRVPPMPLFPKEMQWQPVKLEVEVVLRPFSLRLRQDGRLVAVVNHQQLLNFETHRGLAPPSEAAQQPTHCRDATGLDAADLWNYRFNGYSEEIPEGPRGLGVDIAFCNAQAFYGLAEHAVDWDLPSRYRNVQDAEAEPYRFWNSDVFAYELDTPMALYASIPLLHALHGDGGQDFSVASALWLNAAETYVRLERDAVAFSLIDSRCRATRTWWASETGALDLLLMGSKSVQDATRQYHALTGMPPLPKISTLGLHQSRWQYETQEVISYVNDMYTQYNFPLDYVWLDIDHTAHRKYSEWDSSKFPDPQAMTNALAAEKRDMVVIVDPHVKAESGYSLYDSVKGKHALRNKDGSDFVGWCWPGDSVYMDVLSAAARDLYVPFYKSFRGMAPAPLGPHLPDKALATWLAAPHLVQLWNDMNEPSVFNKAELSVPREVLHLDSTVEHRAVHSLYGIYYHRATYEALLKARPDARRQMVLTRAGFVGSHRYGPLWTGDNAGNWEHMRKSIPMLLSLHACGYSFTGADIPGFFGNPSPELHLRWAQLGLWYPFFRFHGALDTVRREPYLLPEPERTGVRHALVTRYRLMPFMYTTMAKASFYGLPAWSSVADFDLRQRRRVPGDKLGFSSPDWYSRQDSFVIGDTFFVSPVLHSAADGVDESSVVLAGPNLVGWWDQHTLEFAGEGGSAYHVPAATLKEGPVFAATGTVVVTKERFRRSVEAQRFDPLTLTFFVDPRLHDHIQNGGSSMILAVGISYFDDGQSLDAQAEHHVWVTHRLTSDASIVVINQRVVGQDTKGPWRKRIRTELETIVIHGLPWKQLEATVRVDNKTVADSLSSYCVGPQGMAFKIKGLGVDAAEANWSIDLRPPVTKEGSVKMT